MPPPWKASGCHSLPCLHGDIWLSMSVGFRGFRVLAGGFLGRTRKTLLPSWHFLGCHSSHQPADPGPQLKLASSSPLLSPYPTPLCTTLARSLQ